MDRPCKVAIKCPGPQPGLEADSPITNFSSEYTDGPQFDSYQFPVFRPYDPENPKWWSSDTCIGGFTCISYTSQDEADDCARAIALLCTLTPPSTPVSDDPICIADPPSCVPTRPELFPNLSQTASFACPDGSLFYWTVPTGSVYAVSQAMANAVALALAQRRVAQNFICFAALTNQPCVGFEYFDLILVTGRSVPYSFEVIAGELPPGLSLTFLGVNQASVSGIATQVGVYYATIRATGSNGSMADKTFEFSVMGIIDTSIPNATKDSAYSNQLNADGGTEPYTFSIFSGSLPTGLTLSSSGLISGTPTVEGSFSLSIDVQDSSGRTCRKDFSITVDPAAVVPIDWDTLFWNNPVQSTAGPGFAITFLDPAGAGASQSNFSAECQTNTGFPITTAQAGNEGTLVYNGPATSATLTITISSWSAADGDGQADTLIEIWGVGGPGMGPYNYSNQAVGAYPFAIPDTGGVPMTIHVRVTASAINLGLGPWKNCIVVADIA